METRNNVKAKMSKCIYALHPGTLQTRKGENDGVQNRSINTMGVQNRTIDKILGGGECN